MGDDGRQLKETKVPWFKQLFTQKKRENTPNSSNFFTDPGLKDTSVLPELPEGPPQPQPSLEESNYPLFVGKYDYSPRTDDELGFKKGDLIYILNTYGEDWWLARSKSKGEKLIVDSTEGNWWMGKSLTTGREGYIPRNFVAPVTSHESEE